jgi:DNA-binding transcriptional MerR regulator
MTELSIGQLSANCNVKVPTIRYYEQIGLLPEPPRTHSNQRRYTEQHRQRLAFIRHSRELGFPLDSIRELLEMSDHPDQSCKTVDTIARRNLDEVKHRIRRLNALKRELSRMIEGCAGGQVGDCKIIGILADASHEKCLTDRH